MSSFIAALRPLFDRRFLTVFILGFSSGFPWVLHGSVLTLWMQSEGLSRSEIGFIGAVTAIYAINWMWAPFIDKVRLPWLYKKFGQRRSWILFMQAVMIVFILLLSQASPQGNLVVLGVFALGIALASATQDIAVDAYRIMLFDPAEADQKLAYSSAMATVGWWSGYGFIGGAMALFLGGATIGLSWPEVYLALALVYAVLMVLVTLSPEPPQEKEPVIRVPGKLQKLSFAKWFSQYIAAPFVEFFSRCGTRLAAAILLFLFSFKVGEAMLGRMSLVFYAELGFTTEEIALYSKFLGGLATVIFSLLGAVINTRYGVIRGMLVAGIAMAASNLLYALMAEVGPAPGLFMLTLLVDNFTSAFSTVATVTFISYFASRTYTGTQFALMTSISTFGRTTLAASSGVIVDGLDGNWPVFFMFTSLMVIPALLLLVWVGRLLSIYQDNDRVSAVQN
jgi:PAT family beta-lactamase induction signal transducer AmpG